MRGKGVQRLTPYFFSSIKLLVCSSFSTYYHYHRTYPQLNTCNNDTNILNHMQEKDDGTPPTQLGNRKLRLICNNTYILYKVPIGYYFQIDPTILYR